MGLLLLTASMAEIGCSRPPRSEFCAVDGLLIIDGSPAANASVAFHPQDPAIACCAVGRTDAAGHFRLTTNGNADGARAGIYNVTVVWIDETIPFDECECDNPLIHDRLKGYYADRELTELRATIRPGDNPMRLHARRPPDDFPAPLSAGSRLSKRL